jgi:UDP-glucose 4-epimerase
MKTFVVTGCNGYIGSHMCHELGAMYNDCHIIGIDKVEKKHLRHLYDTFEQIDLSLDPIVLSNFDRKPIDAVFHFAAYSSVEEGEQDPWKYYFNNVVGSLRMIKEAKQYGVKDFIFSSTAAVYGESTSPLFGHLFENTIINPKSVYGKSKAMVEEVLKNEKDMRYSILRYFNVAGRNVRANLYEEHDPETHLIPLLASSNTATIFGNDWPTKDGTCIRDYIDVRDICRAHTLAYRYMESQDENLIINVGSGKGYSVKEVVDKANEILHNGEMIVRVTGKRDGDVPYLVADTLKIETTLGFKPQYLLEDILESMKNV